LPEFVDRRTIATLSGGLTTPSALATADCLGKGPETRLCSAKKVFYPRFPLCKWLAGRVEIKKAGK
jgi:hypothetical protein